MKDSFLGHFFHYVFHLGFYLHYLRFLVNNFSNSILVTYVGPSFPVSSTSLTSPLTSGSCLGSYGR